LYHQKTENMKIVITGSLGHISKPLADSLLQKGHSVTIVSSNPERQTAVETLGANAAIGSIEDVNFLTTTFTAADVVYCMEPPINFFASQVDMQTYWTDIAQNYVDAILRSGVMKVVHLSSIGANTDTGNGMLAAHYHVEQTFKQLPDNVSIKFIRPVGFYYNIFAFIHSIKAQGAIIQNYGGDGKEPWVSPFDIAEVIAEEIEKPFEGRTVRYVASDEVSPNEVAGILGNAIGKPDLKWGIISDEEFLTGLLAAGMTPEAAKGLTEMNAGRRSHLYDDYYLNKPTLGKVKLTDFAKEFAAVYNH
jgi:uncharacterized protein YbjT (DUF2867 family)